MTTTTEHLYLAPGYRIIPDWDGYMMNAGMEVWSVARHVPCKGGKTRQIAAKRIKNDVDGRVTLSQDSRRGRFHVYNQLYPITWPELVEAEQKVKRQRPQVTCHKGHPLMEYDHTVLKTWMTPKPNLAYWGTGNRICLWCSNPPTTFPSFTYSRAYGIAIPNHYSDAPAEPKLRDLQPGEAEELEWGEHGFSVK
ncbi:hypothetical protein [Mycobacterium avium]|uniref:hypothetical protein n=1 Tax=Mycobacterium avium TaxID=1764 RepID=UPI0003D1CED8|nr:hypothetical protein [Mycobacterium avium]ETB29471.1 hypothetical protein O971_12380 [Mycobacterium avium subsp. hominissuis 10-4249]KDO96334.1 hypothetical protein MAVA5_11555 [Mycobacterium avium subsp. hominissuis A5]